MQVNNSVSLLRDGLALSLFTKCGQREGLSLPPDHLFSCNLHKYNIFKTATLLSNVAEISQWALESFETRMCTQYNKYNCITLVSLGNQAKNPRQAETRSFLFYEGYKRTNQKTETRDYSERAK